MSAYYSRIAGKVNRFIAAFIIVSILSTFVPSAVFAEDGDVPTDGQTTQEETASSTDNGTGDETQNTSTSTDETATSTDQSGDDETASSTPSADGETASSTDSGTGGGDGTGEDGTDGTGDTGDGDTASTTATSTASSTPSQGEEGTTGSEGPDGSEGAEGTAGATPNDEVAPVEIVSDELLGADDLPEDENTGDIRRTGTNTLIETGIATAQGELSTDANSNDVRSELEDVNQSDYDTYTFTATGTNDAVVTNDGLARSTSGDNMAYGRSTAEVRSGDAVAAFNIANVVNSNVINSDGFVYLANRILEDGESLDLTDTFFPDVAAEEALSDTCSLLSCTAEDVIYNVSQMNHATITNDALVEASTGYNEAKADLSGEITTGNAYAAANVLNVVNSNIIDSNYRLLTYNAIGDLDGDLVLPTGELFDEFFSRPNGTNQVERPEEVKVNVDNLNDADVDNNVEAYAQTGNNTSTTDFDSSIITGRGESESNVLNKVNENTYGGDSLYLLIRVHGYWDGDVVGLPEGLTWEWTPEGVIIYNVDAEIAPSAFLGYDQDSYTANFTNNNRVVLENNITLNAITGENENDGLVGSIETGDAFASANVMNIANTNVIGTNWTLAIVNILGDFEGNISFAPTDIALTGSVSPANPLGPGDLLTYTYTVTNHSNSTATNIILEQTLENAHTAANATTQSANVGNLAPGASTQVSLTAYADDDLPYGTSSVKAYATVSSNQGDMNFSDNILMLEALADNPEPDNGTGTSTGTTTPPNDDEEENNSTTTPPTYTQSGYYAQSSYGGGGPGPSSKSKKKDVEREEAEDPIDPNKAPLLSIKKVALGIDDDEVVTAGESVDYKITVTNKGGNAYDAEVFDVLTNPIGSVMTEQSWDLGTILPGEVIDLTYTTEYNPNTPSGKYTNTASIKAYLKDGMKEKGEAPLKIQEAKSVVEVKGLDLAIGNVAVLAYFPGANGKTSALVTWETSKPSLSQVFYGAAGTVYDPKQTNFGYQNASFKFPTEKAKHAMIINNLQPGLTHAYRIHAQAGKYLATSREYTFTVPAYVASLTLAFPTGPVSAVAGAATSAPAPVTPAPAYVPPKPAPAPTPEPEPQTTSQAPAPQEQKQEGGVVGFVKNVFGFFR